MLESSECLRVTGFAFINWTLLGGRLMQLASGTPSADNMTCLTGNQSPPTCCLFIGFFYLLWIYFKLLIIYVLRNWIQNCGYICNFRTSHLRNAIQVQKVTVSFMINCLVTLNKLLSIVTWCSQSGFKSHYRLVFWYRWYSQILVNIGWYIDKY